MIILGKYNVYMLILLLITGQAFDFYDDDLEHSIWLDLIYKRIKILYGLLKEDGLFWIHLDDVEVHYCKIMLDEIFNRSNFVSHITYERSAVAGLGQGGYLVNTTEHILLYKKSILPEKENLSYAELGLNISKDITIMSLILEREN